MKAKVLLLTLLTFILLTGPVLAVDWSPQGNITLKNRYYIFNWPVANCSGTDVVHGIFSNGTWNCQAPTAGSGDIEGITTDGDYLLGGCLTGQCNLTVNDTVLNATIDARDSDTTYTAGTGITLTGVAFAVNNTYLQTLYILLTDEGNLDVNSSDYWDNLGSPSDINAADITDDNTYVEVAGDTMTGNLNVPNIALTGTTISNVTTISNDAGDSIQMSTGSKRFEINPSNSRIGIVGAGYDITFYTHSSGGADTLRMKINNGSDTVDIDITNAILDMNNNLIKNIGVAGTDFTATGGLTLADNLFMSNTESITGVSNIAGTSTGNFNIYANDSRGLTLNYAKDATLAVYSDNSTGHSVQRIYVNTGSDIIEIDLNNAILDLNSNSIKGISTVTSHLIPTTDDTYDLGNSSLEWRNLYVDGTAYVDAIDLPSNAISEAEVDFDTTCASGNHLYISGNNLACEADDDDPEAGEVQWSDLTDQGSFTDARYCTYASGTGYISCTSVGSGGGGEGMWIDGGAYIYPNGTYANNTNVSGYSNATNFYQSGNAVLDTSDEAGLDVNSSDYWDNLNTPSDINTADVTDDNTYVTVAGDTMGGGLGLANFLITNIGNAGTDFTSGGGLTLAGNFILNGLLGSGLVPGTDNTYDLGNSTHEFKNIYIDGIAYVDAIDLPANAISEAEIDMDTACAAGNHLYVNGNDFACEADADTQLTDEQVQDKAGAMWTGNTETRASVTYQDADGTIDVVVDDMNDEVVDDASPQLGGNLDANAHDIEVDTNNKVCLNGATCTKYIYYDGSNVIIQG